jgi:two-component system phosphate regulon sensor histidine kinase PhoR
MTLSIRGRLLLAYAFLILVTLAIVTGLALHEQRGWVRQQAEATLERAASLAAATLPVRADWDSLADALGRESGYRVTLVDRGGRVIGDSEVAGDRLPDVDNHAGRPEVSSALSGEVGRSSRHSRTVGREMVYVAVPAPPGGEAVVLRLAQAQAALGAMTASLLRISVLVGLVALVVAVPLVLWMGGRQASRIAQLEAVARRLGAGDTSARAREAPPDELGNLGRAVNRMAAEGRARLDALERERDEREAILAHMSDGVALVDAQLRLVRMNVGFAALFAAQVPAPPGTPFREFARVPELDELIAEAQHEGRVVEIDLRLWTVGQRVVHATATPLGGASGGPVLLVLRDLSEVERLNRMRQDFVANVSHELRTPLTSLRGYAETLLEGGLEDPDNRVRFVRTIRDQAVRLEALTEDLLELAGLERAGAATRTDRFDLREAMERQMAAFRPHATRAGLSLEIIGGPAVPLVADRGRIEQVLANLLDNALKYTENGGVTLAAGQAGPRVWCEVTDTGCGIPEEDQPRVFERFYRVDKARSRARGGTGLGLSIVKHIVALHGGEVSVRSRPGEGSTFRFEVPREPSVGAGV